MIQTTQTANMQLRSAQCRLADTNDTHGRYALFTGQNRPILFTIDVFVSFTATSGEDAHVLSSRRLEIYIETLTVTPQETAEPRETP